jgi:hypothetical protein
VLFEGADDEQDKLACELGFMHEGQNAQNSDDGVDRNFGDTHESGS